jgi:hypothetical protein
MNPLHRTDQPTDYQALWNSLRRRLSDLQQEYAHLCASEPTEMQFRKLQGAYSAMNVVASEMDQLLELAREEKRSA